MNNTKAFLEEVCEKILDELQKVEDEYILAKTRHSQIERIIVDIEHEIELDKPSGSDMVKKYKELQTAFRLRRIYKDDVDYLIKFRETSNLKQTKKTINGISSTEISKNNRNYRTRIEHEVRINLLSEFDKIKRSEDL